MRSSCYIYIYTSTYIFIRIAAVFRQLTVNFRKGSGSVPKMENVTSFLSNLISNPFSTPAGQLIERATDVALVSEDWALYMEICDVINETEDGPRDAARAIRKQIANNVGKSNTVIMYTLTILETCVKNCRRPFHVQVGQKDFIQELIRLATPKNNPPQFVLDKVLGLIQTWADAFRGDPELQEFNRVYEELKEKGCEFPMTDLDGIAPIHTPARSVAKSEQVHHRDQERAASVTMQQSHVVERVGEDNAVMLGNEDLAKLRSELDIVVVNCRVFGEMMTENTPGQVALDDWQLMKDLERSCRQMQQRVVDLIARVQNEIVTEELLQVNDQINNAILRYERFERLCCNSAAQSAPSASASAPGYNASMHSAVPPFAHQPVTHSRPDNVLTDTLVDLDDENILKQFSAAGIDDNPPANEDFDMFAQSRQSFEENLPRTNRSAYQNQEEDQSSRGLGAAVALKSRGLAYKDEKDVDEMEQWLKSSSEVPNEAKESATSSEFDSFLAVRAKEVGTSSEGEATQRSQKVRALHNSEEEQALFSL